MPALEGNSIVHSVVRWIPSPYFIFCVKPGFFMGQVYLKHELLSLLSLCSPWFRFKIMAVTFFLKDLGLS